MLLRRPPSGPPSPGPVLRDVPGERWALQYRTVHGYRRAFRMAGSGPVLLLIHGIGDDSSTWGPLLDDLARDHTVLAPDLLGHGGSDKPRGDYSVAAYANGMRDLLGVLDVDRATLVGHSLGGGVAMQFAYQYPERTERIVLIGAGGVCPVREPGPARGLASGRAARARDAGAARHAHTDRGGDVGARPPRPPAGPRRRGPRPARRRPPDATSRSAFLRTLRAVVDWRGQVVTMLDRCYLTAGMPTLLLWGSDDMIVPVEHAQLAHDAMPGSELQVFEGAGHFPFHTHPSEVLRAMRTFLAGTAPAHWSAAEWRELLRHGRED